MDQRFRTVLADPPWPYRSPRAVVGNGGRGAQNGTAADIIQADVTQHYNVMSLEEIKSLPVRSLVANNAHLYLWTTNSFVREAHDVARSWGFEPKTIITWVKTRHDQPHAPSMRTGYWFRSATEHVVFAVRGKLRLTGPAAPTAFHSPRLPHSVKPDSFYTLVEEQSPGPYLELFARRSRYGWERWGNELEATVDLYAGKPMAHPPIPHALTKRPLLPRRWRFGPKV